MTNAYNFSLLRQSGNWMLGIDPEANKGYFEHTLTGSGGELWFEGKALTDYDGVTELSKFVIQAIEEFGYNADYAKDEG